MQRKNLTALLCSLALTGCGAVYIPNEVRQGSYGYHNTTYGDVEVLPLTFSSVQDANADGYVPRPLPAAFADEAFTGANRLSVRERLRKEGLDAIDPPLAFDPDPTRLDPAQEVLPPYLRGDNRPVSPTLSLFGGGVDTAQRPVAVPPAEALPPLPVSGALSAGDVPSAPDYGRTGPQRVALNPPPDVRPEPYLIGPGDVMGLISSLQPAGLNGGAAPEELSGTTKRLIVEGNGRIFVPQAGSVAVGGRTLSEARQAIFDRLIENDLDFDFGVEVFEFNSQKVAVNGPNGAQLLPITVRPLRLGEAIAAAGGLGENPNNSVVRILRGGSIYEVPGRDLSTSADLTNRVLLDGDAIYISSIYDLERALGFFGQQLQLRQLRLADLERESQAQQAAATSERQAVLDRIERADREEQARQRAVTRERARIQFDIAMETYRLEAERLRQEAAIAQFAAQQATNDANEAARAANLQARQAYIDQLRAIGDANRALEAQRRTILRENAAERTRSRVERRALIELEIAEEQDRLDRLAADQERARAAYQARAQFDAIDRDYVFISGETRATTEQEMPLGRSLSLARVIFGTGGGIDPITGDPSEIYLIRRRAQGSVEEPVVVYHLDARDATRFAVATAMEMRPNDVVFINPQPVTNWNRTLGQIIPSTSFFTGTAGSLTGLVGN